ncbi:DUF397 domain-containing protein [Nocardia aurantiaca]|uniref:DUF397 domain-containing protein n=1 Tax=Nocardia aurantiaca TaxID=2675850 RepID=UPI0012B82793|nr:DUF397 domain-containing protein [Nocardia aurantiaca]
MSAEFFKSTFSGGDGTCVEVAHRADRVLIRDSKYTGPSHDQPTLAIARDLWPAFLNLVLSANSGRIGEQLSVNVFADGCATLAGPQGVTLEYDAAEWDAFTKGVANGEFSR